MKPETHEPRRTTPGRTYARCDDDTSPPPAVPLEFVKDGQQPTCRLCALAKALARENEDSALRRLIVQGVTLTGGRP